MSHKMLLKKYLLACECSCDELSFCIYDTHNNKVIALSIMTQTAHIEWGGVVPDIASREHLKYITKNLHELLSTYSISLKDIDYFAATQGPGLPGALLIGYAFTKALAFSFKKPFIPVNHLEGHIYSSLIENNILFPHICLSASGGHTSLYYVKNNLEYMLLGNTLDDAAGECFDKIAKLLGLGFPGGAIIESYAAKNNFCDILHYPRLTFKGYNMSFSGLKTAVLYDLVKQGCYSLEEKKCLPTLLTDEIIKNVSSSLLCAIKDILLSRIEYALVKHPEIRAVTFVGGVSCNEFLRQSFTSVLEKKYNIPCIPCKKKYSTDNAAMIAHRAALLLQEDPYACDTYYRSDIKP